MEKRVKIRKTVFGGAIARICCLADMYYFLYGEGWAHTQAEMLERGLTLRQYEAVSYTHLDVYKRQHRMKKELREIPVGEIVLPDHLKPKTK